MKKIISLGMCMMAAAAFAQNYAVSLIADSLIRGADAVKRGEELRVIIKSPSKAVIKHWYAVTVLNARGASFARYINMYDKAESMESIAGSLYDGSGILLKRVKKKDMGDFSALSNGELASDDRVKAFDFNCSQYPYTVEFSDEKELDGIFFLPSWNPVQGAAYSLGESSFIVEAPEDDPIRYKEIAFDTAPEITGADHRKIYTWKLSGITAVPDEEYRPQWNEINPAVYIAVSQFEIGGYKGDMSTWLSLGQFINSLNAGRRVLPPDVKADVHRIADPLADTEKKIAALYEYMQKSTRYVSIQLGIGGWQPFDASYVAEKKYGDCKALSNYMISLLAEAGISAKYVLVNSGDHNHGLWEDFPSPYFDHVITCVPRGKDTTWLECTDQNISAGYVSGFTGGRKALLIDSDGGHVVSTPSYPANDNMLVRKTEAEIDENGNLSARVSTHFSGLQQDFVSGLIHDADPKQREHYLNTSMNLPTYRVTQYHYSESKGVLPSVDESLVISSANYANITGKRLFLTPNIFSRSTDKFPADDDRQNDLRFFDAHIETDSIQIRIPADYTIEAMPAAVALSGPYGSYSISFVVKGSSVEVRRRIRTVEGRFPKTDYKAAAAYFNEIYKADRSRIVLVKSAGND